MLGSLDDADDVVQTVWLKASRTDLGDVDELAAWFTTVTVRECLDQVRAGQRRGEVLVPDNHTTVRGGCPGSSCSSRWPRTWAASRWFAGRRQTVVADTSSRTDRPVFPLRWLVPALAVVAATIVIGVLRYPGLPARLALGLGLGQLYSTTVWTGLLLIYRSRTDIEAADPVGSASRYRRYLAVWARGMLALIALVDLSLLLVALRIWRVCQLSGRAAALPLLPFPIGLLVFLAVALRAGQAGSRLRGRQGPTGTTTGSGRPA